MSTPKTASFFLSRRVVLRGAATAGAAGAAVPLVAACGDDSEQNASNEGSSGDALTTTSEVAVGDGVLLKEAGVVVVQPSEGSFKAFSSKCTHKGCDVSKFSAETITCECHGSQYSTKDGSVQHPPAKKPLQEVKVNVDGDQITRA